MKLKHLFLAAFAAVATLFTSCEKEEDLGAANVSVEKAAITLEAGEGSETITFTATRDWTLTCPDWIAPSAKNGKASASKQTVTISVEENKGNDRTGDVVISIGLAKATVSVTQKGAMGQYQAEEGDGSKDKPFNVAQAVDAVKNLTWTDKDNYEKVGPYYVRGKVVSIKDAFSAEYGNGTFTISDDGTADGAQFTCYRVYYLENKKWVEGNTQIQVGDVAVIYGELMYYGTGADGKSRVAENVQKGSYLYSLNGETKPTGGVEVDYNNAPATTVADLISKKDETTYYKLTGKVSRFNATYCSFDLTDETGTIYVYSVANKDEWASKIQNDATVTLAGKYKLYKKSDGTEQNEIVDAYILSCEGGTPAIDPNTAPDITVADLIAKNDEENYYKLTGTVSKFNKTYCSFDLTDATGTIYVYSVANKADWVDKIADGATVVLAGQYQLYKKEGKEDQPEIINAIIISCEGGTQQQDSEPKGSGTLADPYNAAKALEVAKALEGGAKTENDVYIAGKIASVKYTFSADYGTATFDISDDGTTSVTTFTCYSVYYLDNRAWVEGDTQIAVGDDVIICGKLVNYKDKSGNLTPETASKEAYIYSLNGETNGGEVYVPVNVKSFKQTVDGFTASWDAYEGATGYVWMIFDETQLVAEEEPAKVARRLVPGLRDGEEEEGEAEPHGYGYTEDTSVAISFGYTDEEGYFLLENFEVGMTYYILVIALGEEDGEGYYEDLSEGYASFVARDMSQSGDETEVVIDIAQIAAAKNWANGTQYLSVEVDGVKATVSGGGNSGKFYTSGNQWRLYQTENATLSFSSEKTIVAVSIEYVSYNTGVLLTSEGSVVTSGQTVTQCTSFLVGNSESGVANGQARVTKMTVTVK